MAEEGLDSAPPFGRPAPASGPLGRVKARWAYMHPLSGFFSRLRTSLASLRRDRAFNVLLRARAKNFGGHGQAWGLEARV